MGLPRFDYLCSCQYFILSLISSIKFHLLYIGWWTRSWDLLFISGIWIVRLSPHPWSFPVDLNFLFHCSVDDSVLQRAVAAIPKDSIFLIEDIDCAVPSREDGDDPSVNPNFMSPYSGMVVPGMMQGKGRKSNVTLSGLLNVLDGVGSEEGKLFFATVRCHKITFFSFWFCFFC